jgi:tetratricopeptide (TPR) repeat protein
MNKFQQALALLQRGQFVRAQTVCNEILASDPQDVDALHLSGLIALQMGNPRRAAELIGRSTELDPRNSGAFFNRGAAQQAFGALDAALESYDKALAIDQGSVEALFNRGTVLLQVRRPADAAASFERALAINPMSPQTHFKRGLALQQLGRPDAALESYTQAITLDAAYADAHLNRGVALKDLGRLHDALACYDRAIELNERSAEAHLNRGNVLRDLKERKAALESYDRAIAINPGLAIAYLNRGNVLAELQQFEPALADYDRGIEIDPTLAEAHSNRGNALRELDQLEAALTSVNRAIALRGDFTEAYSNRGALFYRMQRVQEALASYDQAIAIAPQDEVSQSNKALLLLLAGDLARGWALYEYRWKKESASAQKDQVDFATSNWQGEASLSGKTILLYSEQALGDTIQFCRYAPLVAQRGGRVILKVQRALINLLGSLRGIAQVVSDREPLPEFDYSCSLMSLPAAFGTVLATIPASIPYLRSPPDKVADWKERLGEKTKPRVGLVWSGGFRPDRPDLWTVNRRRNIALDKFSALKHAPVEFYSLQKGQPADSDLARLTALAWDGPTIIDHTSVLHDFTDTAALIENLDLVIAVDTSTAHLAGALGKPVWLLNRFDTCWRWLMHRPDSPWYPTMRIYRQPTSGDWGTVLENVRKDLMKICESTSFNEPEYAFRRMQGF